MKTHMKRYIIQVALAVMCGSGLNAQQNVLPSRSLTIEGDYNPLMGEQGKIMPVPEKQQSPNQSVEVSYLTDPQTFTNLKREPMGVFGESSDSVRKPVFYGLARLGYGLRNLNEGLVDMGWNITPKDFLKLHGTMDGWNSKPLDSWRSRMFTSRIAADYVHLFGDRLSMGLSTDVGFSRYNYRPGRLMTDAKNNNSNLTQNTNEGSLSGRLDFRPLSGLSLFLAGGGEWYIRDGLEVDGIKPKNKEGIIRISAGAKKVINHSHTLSLDYRQKTTVYSWQGLNGCNYKGYTEFTLSPVWYYGKDDLRTSVGLNMDIRTNAGEAFLISPSATLDYDLTNRFCLNLGAVGGVQEYDMRKLARISPYWSENECIIDGYNTINLYAGLTYNNTKWLNMAARMGFRHTNDEIFQTESDSLLVTSVLKQQAADVFYMRLDADMQFSDRAQLKMDITYSNYIGSYRGHKMDLKPAFDANVFGCFNIMKGLDAMFSYRMMIFHWVMGKSMPTVNDLSLTADYDFTDKLSFYATIKHLMGGDYYYYAGYRSLKPAFMLGATYRF